MDDSIDWASTTWRENRRRQHQEFHALSFREKVKRPERMAEVAERLRRGRGTAEEAPGKD